MKTAFDLADSLRLARYRDNALSGAGPTVNPLSARTR